MKGIIVGAGIGGLSTAIAMQQHHIDVKIYEASNKLSPIGAGILVPPNAMIILERYGLAEKIKHAGVCIDSTDIFSSNGRPIAQTSAHFTKNGTGYQVVAILRSTLQSILVDSLSPGALVTGKRCAYVNTKSDGIELFFEDGSSVSARYLVGADGLRSNVRASIFPDSALRYSGQICWRGLSEINLSSKWMKSLSEVWGPGIRFGFVPVGNSKVYWYATKRQEANGIDDPASVKERLLDIYSAFPTPVSEIISQTANSSIISDDLNDLRPLKSWFSKSTVLIGDAAHASTPNLGQGGAQAIEDSWVLAEKLAANTSIQNAFQQFEKLRFSKARKVTNMSWQIGKVTNLRNKQACRIRDALFRSVPDVMTRRQSRMMYDIPY
ncbi:MAG: FAD-dependent monooxygenase [Pseudomonadales bacterium]|nr:FAD-dependent monooxygenase [Pseudomonadales bacterium]